jgi:hypothetical protein
MEKLKAKAVLNKETKNYKRYKISGDCVGTVYIPRKIEDPIIEVELDRSLSERIAEE